MLFFLSEMLIFPIIWIFFCIFVRSLIRGKLVNLFNNPDTNPKGAQIIFTSHAHYLMDGDTLTRDQIWFVAKENGYSCIYGNLSDVDIGHKDRLYHFYDKFGFYNMLCGQMETYNGDS